MNPSSARKHSDSRLETRQSRAKNLSASSNVTDSLLSGHATSASTTRKRKIDSCESVTTAVVSTLDADSSGGDGNGSTTSIHQSTQAKFSKHDELTSQQLAVGSPSSSSSSSQDDYMLMNALMMSTDDEYTSCCCGACSLLGSGAAPYQMHPRYFGEGLGDQRTRCPGVHRFEVYVSDSNALSQLQSQAHLFQTARHSNSSYTNVSSHYPPSPFAGANKSSTNNADFLNSIYGSGYGGVGRGGKLSGTNFSVFNVTQGNFLSAGNAFWKNQKTTVRRFAFECELGDKWIENPNRRSCKMFRTMNKNATGINQVMDKLDVQGVKLTSVLSSGKFSHVFAGQLFTFRHKVAVKIYETKLRGQTLKGKNSLTSTANQKVSLLGNSIQMMTKIFNSSLAYSSKSDIMPDEIALHKLLRHKNVVQLMYVEQIDQHFVSLMELCDYGNLHQMLRACPGSVLAEPICRKYFRDMLEGVAYLHSQNIVHRDIRCENFLVDSHDCVKLCDLSCAARYCNGDDLQTSAYGNSSYLSPEILEKKPFNPRTADVWALGVCLHVLLTSKLPFAASICLTVPTGTTTGVNSAQNPYAPTSPIHTSVSANAAITLNGQMTAANVNVASSAITAAANRNVGHGGNLNLINSNDGINQNNNPMPNSNDNVPPPIVPTSALITDVASVDLVTASNSNMLDLSGSYGSNIQACGIGVKIGQNAQLDQVEIDPLTLMKRGIDLKVVAPSVILSAEALELLKGLLHYVIKVRYSLNRIRSSAWMKQQAGENPENSKPYIGNHYMVANQLKYSSSKKEKELKEAFEI